MRTTFSYTKARFFLTLSVFLGMVSVASAQGAGSDIGRAKALEFVRALSNVIIQPAIYLLMGVALLVFFFGAFQYVAGADSDQARDTGRKHMLWGIVGLLVMISAVTILEIALNTFGLGGELQNATGG